MSGSVNHDSKANEIVTEKNSPKKTHFVIILTHSIWAAWGEFVRTTFKFRLRMENSSCVHVLHKILKLVITPGCVFAENAYVAWKCVKPLKACMNLVTVLLKVIFLLLSRLLKVASCSENGTLFVISFSSSGRTH